MKISIVIPTYRRCDLLKQTLPSVFVQDFPAREYEVVVVVGDSADGTLELLRSLHPDCTLRIVEHPNRGPAAARNAGLRAACGDLVLFLDDDILCDRSLLRAHVDAHAPGEPRLVFGPVELAPESMPGIATEWTRVNTNAYIARLRRDGKPRWPEDALVDANSSVSRFNLLGAGGFDERFFLQRENADLGLRLWTMGVRFLFQPTAVVSQVYTKTPRDLLLNDAVWYGRNEVLLCRKHPEYRRHSPLSALAEGQWWRRMARHGALRSVVSPDLLLRVLFWPAERLRAIPALLRATVRLLEIRQGIAMYRSALKQAGSWEAVSQEFGVRLPVLLYHRVGPPRPRDHPPLTISPDKFERQVRWLARQGYVGIRPSDWLMWCQQGKPLPKRPMLFAFEDACANLAEYVLPVLNRHGFGALVLVARDENPCDEAPATGPPVLMTPDQIHEWAKQGFEFVARRTRSELTAVPGPVPAACELGLTVEEGLNSLRTDPHRLQRTLVQPDDSFFDLACRVRMGRSLFDPIRARVASVTRGVQGSAR